ncbi:MAG: carboxypeptidase-like regulatory domain-containing protein [Gemmatimonadota bacterium]
MHLVRRTAFVVVAMALSNGVDASAQQLRGVVRDSASGRPIMGAVVSLIDSAGTTIMRGVSNEVGVYQIPFLGAARRGRIVRLGFRPRNITLPAMAGTVTELNLTLAWLATILEPVRTFANAHCPRRKDERATAALLEQTRAGLLTSVVQRESDPPMLILYDFEREMDGTSDRISSQNVRRDSLERAPKSYQAAYTAGEFITRGFMRDDANAQWFFVPDADVLLDDEFTLGYCFRIVDAERARPNQVGLGFVAAESKRNRIDVDGVIWIDTAKRSIGDMTYRYAGFPSRIDRLDPGGLVAFRDLSTVSMIDNWSMRLIGAHYDSTFRNTPTVERLYAYQRGGLVAHATWPDGRTWHADLGKLRAHVRTSNGKPAAGTVVRIPDTPYRATVDSAGFLELSDLVNGPYTLAVVDPRLEPIRFDLPTSYNFLAVNGTTVRDSIKIQTVEEAVALKCLSDKRYTVGDSIFVLGRAIDRKGNLVGDVQISAFTEPSQTGVIEERGEPAALPHLIGGYTTGTNGLFQFCAPRLETGVTIRARLSGRDLPVLRMPVTGRLTVIPLVVDRAP